VDSGFPQPESIRPQNRTSHLNLTVILLIVGSVFVLISTILTLAACMLSSRISQTEEFVELLVHAVNHQMTGSLVIDDQGE
jgi:hypothetical protein